MNRLLSILSLFILSMQLKSSYAQGETFAPIGAEWCYGSSNPTYNVHYSKYIVEKDTIIMGQVCRKITGYLISSERGREDSPPLYVYSTPDTVYRYYDSFQLFAPMYIFNVSEGDTLTYHVSVMGPPGSSWSDSLFQVIVTKVDSVYVDGIYLRQVWTLPLGDWGFEGSYIERIGSTFGMEGNVYLIGIPEAYERGLRSYQDTTISYRYTDYDCEFLPGTVIHQHSKPEEIRLFPNPSDGNFTLDLGRLTGRGEGLKITDLTGRQIFPNVTIGYSQLRIDMSSLPPGVYLLFFESNKGQSYHKIIKK